MKSKFKAWVLRNGVQETAAALGVIPRTVYFWINGRNGVKAFPRRKTAEKIVELSAGKLTLSDVLGVRRG